jgi:hypothetical protein
VREAEQAVPTLAENFCDGATDSSEPNQGNSARRGNISRSAYGVDV